MSESLATRMTTFGARARDMATERIGTLFDRYQHRLYRLARRLLSDPEEARDLVQETFLRAARKPQSLPASDPRAEAWLVRVLVNLCRDRYRRRAVRRRPQNAVHLTPPTAANPEARAVARAAVAAALAKLGPKRRAVVVLRELEELPVADVARLLGMNPGTVRWHHSKGRRQMIEFLETESGHPPGSIDEERTSHDG